jgi:hypothetical protein
LPLLAVAASEDGSDVAAAVPEAEPFAGAATGALPAAVFAPVGPGVPTEVANASSFAGAGSAGAACAFAGVVVAI